MRLIVPFAALVALAGCAPQVVNLCPAVPLHAAEVVPLPPVSEQPVIWQPGHFDFVGDTYIWRAGAWVPRTGPSTHWMEGYWSATSPSGPCVWNAGHWM